MPSKVGYISPSPTRGRIETLRTSLLTKFEENLDEPGVFHLREETGRNEKVYPLGKQSVPSETKAEIFSAHAQGSRRQNNCKCLHLKQSKGVYGQLVD